MALLGEVGRCRGWGQPVGLGSAIVAPELNHGLEPIGLYWLCEAWVCSD